MSRPSQRARYVLPTTINPSTSTCWMVQVPDDQNHVAAFKGAIRSLGSFYSWQQEPTHKASDVAAVWREIFDNLVECQVLTFRQQDNCNLQVSDDGGSTWTTIYDGQVCLAANPDQSGASGTVPAQECRSFLAHLSANNVWILPVPVQAGDTVTISGATGIANDGSGTLFCPDGAIYSLGVCSGGGTSITDPLSTANHMSVILGWVNAGNQYGSLSGGTFTIPAGTPAVNAWIQVNDVVIGDDQGSYEFNVSICSGEVCYSDTFDAGYGTKTVNPSATPVGTWNDGAWNASGGHVSPGNWQGTVNNVLIPGIVVDLGANHLIDAVDFWYKLSASETLSLYVTLYDNTGTLVSQPVSSNFSATPTWAHLIVASGLPASGVRYVVFSSQKDTTTRTVSFDDLTVCYR